MAGPHILLHKWDQADLSQQLQLFTIIICKVGTKMYTYLTSSLNYMDKEGLQK